MDTTCRCGHERAAHEHYRKGSDCALCPAGECTRYRPRGPVARRAVARLVAALGAVLRRR